MGVFHFDSERIGLTDKIHGAGMTCLPLRALSRVCLLYSTEAAALITGATRTHAGIMQLSVFTRLVLAQLYGPLTARNYLELREK